MTQEDFNLIRFQHLYFEYVSLKTLRIRMNAEKINFTRAVLTIIESL